MVVGDSKRKERTLIIVEQGLAALETPCWQGHPHPSFSTVYRSVMEVFVCRLIPRVKRVLQRPRTIRTVVVDIAHPLRACMPFCSLQAIVVIGQGILFWRD